MAGMGDNPLVGEYTKGISKGRQYWVDLDARIKREKFNPKSLVPDLSMGLFTEQKRFLDSITKLTGSGRFGPVVQPVPATVPETRPLPKSKKTAKSFSEIKMLLENNN